MDPLRASLFLLTVLGISRLHQQYGFIGALRPGILLVGVALGYAFLKPSSIGSWTWTRLWPARVVGGLAVVSCLSALFGISVGGSARFFIDNYSKVLISGFLLIAAIRSVRDLRLFLWSYVVGAAALSVMAIFVFQLQVQGGVSRLGDMQTWDSNDAGCILLVALPLAMMLFQTARGVRRAIVGVMILAIAATIARTGSRGAFLGLAIVFVAFLLSVDGLSVAKRLGIAVTVAAGLAIAAPAGYWSQMGTIGDITSDYNWEATGGRKQLAIRGLGYMMSRPVFGIGINNFGRAEGTISEQALNWVPGMPGVKWSAPHNTYIQAGAEMGVIGFALWIVLVGGCIASPAKVKAKMPTSWESGNWEERFLWQCASFLPLAAIGFASTSFFVSFAYHDPIYFLAALNSGLIVCVRSRLARLRGSSLRGRSALDLTSELRSGVRA